MAIGALRRFGVAGAALVALVLLVLPAGGTERAAVARIAAVAATAVCLLAVAHIKGPARTVWFLLWGAQALTVVGDVIYTVGGDTVWTASPGITDVFYLATYPLYFAGLALLVHRAMPDRGLESWIDATIVATACAAVLATAVLAPLMASGSGVTAATILALAYPVADLLVLAVLARIITGLPTTNPALVMVTVSTLTFVIADIWYQWLELHPDASEPAVLEVLWFAAIALLTWAALLPSAAHLADATPVAGTRMRKLHLVAVGLAVATPPVLLVWVAWRTDVSVLAWLAALTLIMTGLLLWRIALLVRTVDAQALLLAEQARSDSLTGLPNRRVWDAALVAAALTAQRDGTPLAIAMLDLDHFKAYNDRYGHQRGDEALVAIATHWRRHLPATALLARYGGEEFGLLLPGLTAQRVRRVLNDLLIDEPGLPTVSIGVASLAADETASEALRRADLALYQAKDAGRNRMESADGFSSRTAHDPG